MTTARKLLTADDLLAMPDDGKKYELVRGELIEMPPPGFMHGMVIGRIGRRIGNFVEEHSLDFVETFEVGIYTEQDPDTVRAPDYTLTSLARIIAPLPQRGYVFGLIPDLVVEVISPGYSTAAAEARAQMWLDAGVRLALIAYIATQEIVAHSDDGAARRFGIGDTLTCEPVLPGFACQVAEIFARH
ncbi:MAG: Uma2 family endonuclease [Chloroflexota bacterium]|nr:Uma2 family endonuclease [Chloroflexota bacterium]MDE2962127.1 Uma2 family endonuclease [Chloroflexota bacterium]